MYTRSGDRGETGLVGGKRVPKDSQRIEAYGTLDELNAVVGLARVFNEEKLNDGAPHSYLDDVLRRIQEQLFDLGGELATADRQREDIYRIGEDEVKWIEHAIDRCQEDLEPLQSFVLPGGGKIGAHLHQARTVCRRVEREVLRLSRAEEIGEWPIRYLNRLSDLFFVLSRWVGKQSGEKEYLWQRALRNKPHKK